MDLIVSLPGEESCRGFFIVSLFVELAASSGIMVRTGCCYSSSFTSTVSEPQTDAAYSLCVPLIVCVCLLLFS